MGHLIESEVSEFTITEDDWSVRRYLRRVIGKTAVLFALAFHIGAAEAGDNPDARRIEILRRIGYNVGIGFQIIDDVLDLFGDRKTTGKPVGGDLRRGIRTPADHLGREQRTTVEVGPQCRADRQETHGPIRRRSGVAVFRESRDSERLQTRSRIPADATEPFPRLRYTPEERIVNSTAFPLRMINRSSGG